jgi:tetratricopeptide (TPR) repeat protein
MADFFSNKAFFKADELGDVNELRRIALLNRAMCMLKLGDVSVVKTLCTDVLSEDSQNPKALFRRAKAHLALKEYPEATTDLERLLEVEPNSREGRQLLSQAKRLRKQDDSVQSRTFAKMCGGLGDMPDRTDRTDEGLVKMPDIDAEFAKIAAKHGLPRQANKKAAETSETPATEAEAAACEEAGKPCEDNAPAS